jgi:hypothetical protein
VKGHDAMQQHNQDSHEPDPASGPGADQDGVREGTIGLSGPAGRAGEEIAGPDLAGPPTGRGGPGGGDDGIEQQPAAAGDWSTAAAQPTPGETGESTVSGDQLGAVDEAEVDPLEDEDSYVYRRRYGNEAGLIIGMVEGRPLHQVANMAGLSIRTVQRRLQEPRIQKLINDGQVQVLQGLVGQVLMLQAPAVEILRTGLEAESEHVRFRSADALVRTMFRLAGDVVVRQQIGQLADAVQRLQQAAAERPVDGSEVDLLGQFDEDGQRHQPDADDGS